MVNKETSRYFYWVDVLRVLAALSVVIWHYQHFLYPADGCYAPVNKSALPFHHLLAIFYTHGNRAVELFWVISGFVFASVYVRSTAVSAKRFFLNRLARLYPLHILTLLVVAGLQLMSARVVGHCQLYSNNDLYHFILNLFFASGWGLERGYSFNGPIWSVSIEVAIYAVFFMALRSIIKNRTAVTILFILIFISLIQWNIPGVFWRCGVYFFLGSLMHHVWRIFSKRASALFSLSGAGLVVALALGSINPDWTWTNMQFIFLFPSLVLLTATLDLVDIRSLGSCLKISGDMTYGIYLWHVPIQLLMIFALAIFKIDRAVVSSASFFFFFVFLVLIAAYFSFLYFELPMRKWIRGL